MQSSEPSEGQMNQLLLYWFEKMSWFGLKRNISLIIDEMKLLIDLANVGSNLINLQELMEWISMPLSKEEGPFWWRIHALQKSGPV